MAARKLRTGTDDDEHPQLSSTRKDKEKNNEEKCVMALDLDVCVPQWMKENFAEGIYPNLQQRRAFAESACDYVEESIDKEKKSACCGVASCLVSFSFVNSDLRDTYRLRFPSAQWVLIDTDEEEAQRRIESRQGHFYKGKKTLVEGKADELTEKEEKVTNVVDNSEWNFNPVTFPHVVLDGTVPANENADIVVRIVQGEDIGDARGVRLVS
jgi:gluconate kinase